MLLELLRGSCFNFFSISLSRATSSPYLFFFSDALEAFFEFDTACFFALLSDLFEVDFLALLVSTLDVFFVAFFVTFLVVFFATFLVVFFAAFFVVFLATFFVVFFATFFVVFFATFFVVFFATFFVVFLATFLAAFFNDFLCCLFRYFLRYLFSSFLRCFLRCFFSGFLRGLFGYLRFACFLSRFFCFGIFKFSKIFLNIISLSGLRTHLIEAKTALLIK